MITLTAFRRPIVQLIARLSLSGASLLAIAAPLHAQPYVGVRVLQSAGMPVMVVYPTQTPSQTVQRGPYSLDVAMQAEPSRGNGKLIVLSHGTGGDYVPDHSLAAALARAGFVVAQPRHRGDNYLDTGHAGPESWKTRPTEISETIDLIAHDPVFGPLVDTQQVGVHGMSAGGATGITMAGGRWRVLSLIQHCNAHWDEDIGFCANGLANQPQAQQQRKDSMAGVRQAPSESLLPPELTTWYGGKDAAPGADPRPDARVAAVTLAVPVAAIFSAPSLQAIRIPVGVVVADADQVLLPAFHADYLLQNCSRCLVLHTLHGGGHFDTLSPWPREVAQEVAKTQVRGGLPHDDLPPQALQQAHAAIVSFYLQNLK